MKLFIRCNNCNKLTIRLFTMKIENKIVCNKCAMEITDKW